MRSNLKRKVRPDGEMDSFISSDDEDCHDYHDQQTEVKEINKALSVTLRNLVKKEKSKIENQDVSSDNLDNIIES